MSGNNPNNELPVPPPPLTNFFTEEEQAKYNEQLAQLAAGQPVGLDGVGTIEATPPGQPVPGT